MLFSIIGLIVASVIAYILFVSYYPSFGGDVNEELKLRYSSSKNYSEGEFVNVKNVPEEMGLWQTLKIARKFFFTKVENGVPDKAIGIQQIDSVNIANYNGNTRLIWFGHSAFLLQMKGKNILIDPMFGAVPAPHPLLGRNRFNSDLPIEIEKLPYIDAIIISHDHYDHLDYESIMKLKSKVKKYYTPLAVGVHLKAWGVEEQQIVELDWWQNATFENLEFICTPAQHFSGRKINNRQSTLWSSWVIRSAEESIFFSGDSGYGPHFDEIGDKYGPFDFAMIECGQYNKMWPDIHMFPEETVQAGIDLRSKAIMPIHWGSFQLALHSWIDPIERAKATAEELKANLVTPEIGQAILINDLSGLDNVWWK